MRPLKAVFAETVLNATGAERIVTIELIQSLWSGYGEILRVGLQGAEIPSVILKYISFPVQVVHPRGWGTDFSHQRKITSYNVEMHWYRHWAERCDDLCRVPRCYAAFSDEQDHLIVLEDLDHSGYVARKNELSRQEVRVCLQWLANFHARFLEQKPEGLWDIGTYWHLKTRPDEYAAMPSSALKAAAAKIDARLNQCRFQTIVHGDAKVANFCFSEALDAVAVVDFQYVGGGCGMKDVAYFLGSCLTEKQCLAWEDSLLDEYFSFLQQALSRLGKPIDFVALRTEWLDLFPWAWTDFYRFLVGWMPDHRKINKYTEHLASKVLTSLP